MLPAEFLDDSSSEDEDGDDADGTAAAKSSLPKKRKVAAVERQLTRLDRGPRDQQVGTTVFSVAAKKQDGRLAPKAKYGAKARKEALLRRNRAAVQPRAGFFRQ